MELDNLKAFVAVVENQSFSAAARHLHITQPAVSKRVAALETHLGQSLFNRIGREVSLTEAGSVLLPRAKKLLKDSDDALRAIRELSGEISGVLKVATSHHIGLHHLPPILREFSAKYPLVNLQIEFLDSERAHERVVQGDCDLAIVTLSPEKHTSLDYQAIWHDELIFTCFKEHELAKLSPVSLERLSRTPAILPDLNTFTGRYVKQVFDKAALNVNLSMSTNYLETIKMMVSVGLGWSVLPKTLVDDNLVEITTKDARLFRTLGIVKHNKRHLGNAAIAFFELVLAFSQSQRGSKGLK